jgi:riboflavin synthase
VFTGIVRERARVRSLGDGRLNVEARTPAEVGDSVAIDGVCLTVVGNERGLEFDVVEETLRRVKPFREEANVEPAVRAGEPLGGHLMQGHVDGIGRVRSVGDDLTWIDPPPDLLRYCVEKGSIAVDGVSLTIAALDQAGFAVALVPHTKAVTTLGSLRPGDEVNIEVDLVAKYVERLAVQ